MELTKLVIRGMDEGLTLLYRLQDAEAIERRLATELTHSTADVEIARLRYEANRDLVRDMWQALRIEMTARREVQEAKKKE